MAATELALCITDLDVGGAERALVDLAVRLDRRRFHPVVYCLGPRPLSEDSSCVPPLERAGITVHFLEATGKLDFVPAVHRLSGLLARQNAILVQSFLFHANLVGRLAASRAGVRLVLSGIRVAERRQRWHLWADRLTSGKVDRYVCVSRSVADFSAYEAGLPESKLIVIPNGIDLANYRATSPADLRPWGISANSLVVTYLGRMAPQKGLDWLISSTPNWLGRDERYELLLVGQGPDLVALRRIAAATPFAERIHFTGWRKDVCEILAASHLLVLPSRWEGMPNAVLQAMASRLPVVATDVEGVRELLGPDADHQMVAYGDSAALGERISAVLSDISLAERLGTANRTRAEKTFALDSMVSAYQDLWDSLLRENTAG